jgi:hypothetical protein
MRSFSSITYIITIEIVLVLQAAATTFNQGSRVRVLELGFIFIARRRRRVMQW